MQVDMHSYNISFQDFLLELGLGKNVVLMEFCVGWFLVLLHIYSGSGWFGLLTSCTVNHGTITPLS